MYMRVEEESTGILTVVVLAEDVLGDKFGGLEVRVSNDSGRNFTGKTDVFELSVHLRGVDGNVGRAEVGGEADLEVDLLGLVVGGDEVFAVVFPSKVAGKSVGLVGSVLY